MNACVSMSRIVRSAAISPAIEFYLNELAVLGGLQSCVLNRKLPRMMRLLISVTRCCNNGAQARHKGQ
jgi:hypothetical protein